MSWLFGRKSPEFTPHDTLPFVHAPDASKPIELTQLDVDVKINGVFAETTQTMTFYNPNRRDLEGEVSIPLTDGAVVTGYALDVRGEMMDSVVVTKKRARQVLEAEIRKGVDPGLVEKVAGNVYRTRLYPIPGKGQRTVRITTVSTLTVSENAAAYDLPLEHAQQVDRVSLRIQVLGSPAKPTIAGKLGNATMNEWQNTWVAEAKLGKGRPSDDLQVRLPDLPADLVSIETTDDHETFFSVSAAIPPLDTEEYSPKRIAIAWDASGSRADVARELDLLETLLTRWGGVTVDLVTFRDTTSETKTFDTTEDQGAALLAALRSEPRDGATRIGALDFSSCHPDTEMWLLISDGLSSIGNTLPTLGDVPVMTICGQANNNGALLRHLAEQTGGAHLNLLTTPREDVSSILSRRPARQAVTETEGCKHVYVTNTKGRLQLLGKVTEAKARVVVTQGQQTRSFEIDTSNATTGKLLARAWAGKHAEVLELTKGQRSEDVLRLARRYGIVTSATSLLVLESLEQFLEHDIEPPSTHPTLQRQWRERRDGQRREKEKQRREHIDEVAELWRKRVAWWEREFRIDPDRKHSNEEVDGLDDVIAPAPPISGAMPPAEALPSPAPAMHTAAVRGAPRRARRDVVHAKKVKAKGGANASISIQPWTPSTPYLRAMRQAADPYAEYLTQRPSYAQSPSFFLDCGDYLLSSGDKQRGVQVLSNLMELGLDDPPLMRMYAWRLQQAGELDRSIEVLERVLKLRDDEPQSYRDLALALSLRFDRNHDPDDATRAIELLYEVVQRQWERFPEIELIALMELNRLVHLLKQAGKDVPQQIDDRLLRHLDLDLRISMSWDADLTDVDLHVFEPTGGHAYYGHNLTNIGGLVSRDFTQGYGPEEYVLRKAPPGDYLVRSHYYGSSQQDLVGPCTVIVTVFTNWGRPNEERQVLTLRLDKPGDQIDVGKITIEDDGRASSTDDPAWKEKFGSLKIGMTVDEVTARCGQPTRLTGTDQLVLVYEPQQGVLLHVVMSPKLVRVEHVMEGAVVELVS